MKYLFLVLFSISNFAQAIQTDTLDVLEDLLIADKSSQQEDWDRLQISTLIGDEEKQLDDFEFRQIQVKSGGSYCVFNSHCPGHQACVRQVCVDKQSRDNECMGDIDCSSDDQCVATRCEPRKRRGGEGRYPREGEAERIRKNIKKVQRCLGVPATGKADNATLRALKKASPAKRKRCGRKGGF